MTRNDIPPVRVAMVLAAGRGERMRPLTAERAKPTLPVLGRPILGRILHHLAGAGVRTFAVNAHHGRVSIEETLATHAPEGARVELFPEETLMGTGGALAAPADLLGEEPFFLLHNGDTLADVPVGALAAAAAEDGAIGALLVRRGRRDPYRPVLVKDGRFSRLGGDGVAPAEGEEETTYLGIGVLRREVLERVPRDRPSDLFGDVLLPFLEEGRHLAVVPYDGPWLEFTSPEGYLATLRRLVHGGRRARRVELPGGPAPVAPRDSGVLFAAEGAEVDVAAALHGAVVVERGARVQRGALVMSSVILEDAEVPWNVMLDRVVVGPGVRIARGGCFREGVLHREGDTVCFTPFPGRLGPTPPGCMPRICGLEVPSS